MLFSKKGPHLAVLLGCTFYGMTGLFLVHIRDMPITSIIFYRLFFGLLLIMLFVIGTGKVRELKPGKKKLSLLMQGIFVVVNMFFYFICVKETCVSIAILLEYTAPIYVMLASPFLLKEKIGKENIAALFVAVTGVFLVIRPEGGFSEFELSGSHFIGIASGLFAGMILAAIIMNVRVLKTEYTEFSIAFWGTAISCLFMIPFAFESPLSLIVENVPALMAFGMASVGLGGILTTIGFANLESQTGSLLALIEPVAGVFFDVVVLGISLSSTTLFGCLLVLIASLIVSFRDSSEFDAVQSDSAEKMEPC